MTVVTKKQTVAFLLVAMTAFSAHAAGPTQTQVIQSVTQGLPNGSILRATVQSGLAKVQSSPNSRNLVKTLEVIARNPSSPAMINLGVALAIAADLPQISSEMGADKRVVFKPTAAEKSAVVAKVRGTVPASDLLGLTDEDIVTIVTAQLTLATGDASKLAGNNAAYDDLIKSQADEMAKGAKPCSALFRAAVKAKGDQAKALEFLGAIVNACGIPAV